MGRRCQLEKVKMLVVQLCPTLCNPTDCSPPRSMEFSKQEYWSGLPFPSAGDLPNLGIGLHYKQITTEPPGVSTHSWRGEVNAGLRDFKGQADSLVRG